MVMAVMVMIVIMVMMMVVIMIMVVMMVMIVIVVIVMMVVTPIPITGRIIRMVVAPRLGFCWCHLSTESNQSQRKRSSKRNKNLPHSITLLALAQRTSPGTLWQLPTGASLNSEVPH
jgi:multisubunit Na+/H+ antiporter MnhE subunit